MAIQLSEVRFGGEAENLSVGAIASLECPMALSGVLIGDVLEAYNCNNMLKYLKCQVKLIN